MKFLIVFISILLFGADVENSKDWFDYTIIAIVVMFLLYYIINIIESFKKGEGSVLITFFVILVIWRGYVNYSVGGSVIPFSFSELNEWFFNDLGIIEGILWFLLLISPFYFAKQRTCPACNSSNLQELHKEKTPKGIKKKSVDGITREFNIYQYDTTYKCLNCGNEFKDTETKEELI